MYSLANCAKEGGQPARESSDQGDGLLRDLVAQHARDIRDDDGRLDHARHEQVVQSGGGRLNPLQPTAADDLFPRHRHFRMAAKQVGRQQFFRDALLRRVDHLGLGRRGLNLRDMFRFERVAENDSHGGA